MSHYTNRDNVVYVSVIPKAANISGQSAGPSQRPPLGVSGRQSFGEFACASRESPWAASWR